MILISPQGQVQTIGLPGQHGSIWRNGFGVPLNTLGIDNDYYIDKANGKVYLRVSGAYVYQFTIILFNPNSGWRIKDDTSFQLFNPDQSLYQTAFLVGAAEAESLAAGTDFSGLTGWQILNNCLWLYNIDQAIYQMVFVDGAEGEEELSVGTGSFGSIAGFRIKDNNFQLYNPTQLKYHTVFWSGGSGAESLSIGPGEA